MSGETITLEESIALHPSQFEADIIDIRTGEEAAPVSIQHAIEQASPNDENAQSFNYIVATGVAERASRMMLVSRTTGISEILGLEPLVVEDQILSTFKEIAFMRDEFNVLQYVPSEVGLYDELARRGVFGSQSHQDIATYLDQVINIKRYFYNKNYNLNGSEDQDRKAEVMLFNQSLRIGIEAIFADRTTPYIESQTHLPNTYTNPPTLIQDFLEPIYIQQGLPYKHGLEQFGGSRLRPTRAFQYDAFILWAIEEYEFHNQNLGEIGLRGYEEAQSSL